MFMKSAISSSQSCLVERIPRRAPLTSGVECMHSWQPAILSVDFCIKKFAGCIVFCSILAKKLIELLAL